MAALRGVQRVEYLPENDLFAVEFDPGQLRLEMIFVAVVRAGRKNGQEFLPELVEAKGGC